MNLQKIRDKIDAIDSNLLRLLNERSRLSEEVGKVKLASGRAVFAPDREEMLLRRLVRQNKGPIGAGSLRAIYREILSASRSRQKQMMICYFGPKGASCHQAAMERFGAADKFVSRRSIPDVFGVLERGEVDASVVPSGNSSDGTGNQVNDMLAVTDLLICGEIYPRRRHANIHEASRNQAYYFILSREMPPPSGHDKTSLLLAVENEAGALGRVLRLFAGQDLNMEKIESRPSSSGKSEYLFFVDVKGHSQQPKLRKALGQIRKKTRWLKILGSYPQAQHHV